MATATSRFHRLCLITLVAVYFLILVGGIVRSTGSGMGCPDWPKCFGSWVPPTSADQLPKDYKEKFAAIRDTKNQKFARYLKAFGFESTANAILNDKSILIEADFNVTKTWIEYLNRIVGVTIGFLITAVFVMSFKLRKQSKSWFWVAFATLIVVIIQGWFGSIVVSTNLTTWTITIHMLMAFVLVALLIWLYEKSAPPIYLPTGKYTRLILAIGILLLIIQVLLGTEVRAGIDRAALFLPREAWIMEVGEDFLRHRSFSWILVLVHVVLVYRLFKTSPRNPLPVALVLLILLTLITGVGMAYFAVPAFLQPIHLLVATLTFGVQFLLILRIKTS
ncbi:MAG TPA: COX15/CtaA family protein [Cyclobacteriaceae bacterium]|jgi:cytochrome c oxidase assembly protein subunit 15|nr:COX15/CtaA family protein [Cytophagales bacterium]HNT50579.1 COX15/CtaA family protein [Cyclobacteriaceae bacterium]HRE66197.1 COX15/CtaA family protein [Cyclobacteriaceae bacterium]HRF32112.1 COX15/CtaA family protein [Cyclobacteriaceae bacterium]